VLTLLLLWRPQRLARLVSRRFKPRLDATAPGVLSTREMETWVDMEARRILVPNQSLEQLIMPTNDEIDLTKAALDIGVQA